MVFPGAGASVHRNEAGEVLGWDYPGDDPYDPDDYLNGDYDDGGDEPDGMHDYEGDPEAPCLACGLTNSDLHW